MTWLVKSVRDIVGRWFRLHRYVDDQHPEEIEELERRARRAQDAMDRQIRLMTGREGT